MRLYDFVQIEPSKAEFLISIFTVGDWYVNNVYTYQGGKDTVSVVENNAKIHANENAYKRWKDYRKSYFKGDGGFYSDSINDNNQPYTSVIKFVGEQK